MNNNETRQGVSRDVQDDEISLVDLAKILIKRWKLMVATFLVVVLVALAYALMMERTYEYVSIYQVAEQAPRDSDDPGALEAPATVVAKVTNLYLGPVTRELRSAENLDGLPFDVSVSNPDDTLLIRLSSETSEAHGALVETMHATLLERIKTGQQSQLERRRTGLERQLENAQRSLEAAQESTSANAAELIASYSNRVAELENRLALLREGQVAQTAVQSLEPTGTGRSLIMALAIVLGGMLAVMGAFFMQFAVAVRESLVDEG
ncbi:Wzz/FepE/Etk N-terminal domain-containing protein [Halomonas sp.]|uniref:Wzz/FepE/Etk N-terminal domain-containing protein n=1 Tax=Halomonas sp. TaxID=1486246 RepID=UPI00298EA3BE|nr:Wzz/FepE/Etk N-terminal domain-containing protein [Halomonas sp.]MDW7748700.1 Wzz/FepE/Etk N-terminal domain-containing protein [Halomonas sp.]